MISLAKFSVVSRWLEWIEKARKPFEKSKSSTLDKSSPSTSSQTSTLTPR